jgi:hypothetical protein
VAEYYLSAIRIYYLLLAPSTPPNSGDFGNFSRFIRASVVRFCFSDSTIPAILAIDYRSPVIRPGSHAGSTALDGRKTALSLFIDQI